VPTITPRYTVFSFTQIRTMQPSDFAHCTPYPAAAKLKQLTAFYEPERRTVWLLTHPHPRPCFTVELIRDFAIVQYAIEQDDTVDFCVFGSSLAGVFNNGGDLEVFAAAIRSRDEDKLRDYAYLCIDAVDSIYRGFDRNCINIALVEGSALGGGFECALAHHYVFAQNDVKLGFPEIAFNLFPGMGAYSFVSRNAGPKLAQQMITSGEAQSAQWCEEKGLVDGTFEPGLGIATVRAHIDKLRTRLNGVRAMFRTARRVNGVRKDELLDVTDDWVSSALKLTEPELAYMERLVKAQRKRMRTSKLMEPAMADT
jgi:DSF synthase